MCVFIDSLTNHMCVFIDSVTNHILRMLWRYPGVRNDRLGCPCPNVFNQHCIWVALSYNDAIARSHWRRQISVVWSHRAVGTGASVRKTLWSEGERGALYLGLLYLCCLYCTTHWQIWYPTDINVWYHSLVLLFPLPLSFCFPCIDNCGTTPLTSVSYLF